LSATRDVVDDAEDDDARVFIASIARALENRADRTRASVCGDDVRNEKKRYGGVLFLN